MAPLTGPLASTDGIEATQFVRPSSGPGAASTMEDQTALGRRRLGLQTTGLGLLLSRRWRLGIITRPGTYGITDAGLRMRLQGSLPSRLTTMVVVEVVGVSMRRAEGRIKETPPRRLSEGRKNKRQVAWKTPSPTLPIFAVYRPSRPDALPRRLTRRITAIARPLDKTEAKTIPLPCRLVQRNAAVAGRK